MAQIEQEGIVDIMVTSGFGYNTQQPYVQVLIQKANWMTQMTPETARELAFNLLTAADGADSDGFLVSFFRQSVGVNNIRMLATILSQFRDYREASRKGSEADGNEST